MMSTNEPELSPDVAAARARLEAEVEALKARKAAQEAEHKARALPGPQIAPTSGNVPPGVSPTVAEFYRALGRECPTAAELEQAEKERREAFRAEVREVERRQTVAKFERMLPLEFRDVWEWDRVPADCDHDEIEKVWRWKFGPRGLFIVGPTGYAKSRALYVLARRLAHEGRNVELISGVRFAVQAGGAFGEPGGTERWLDRHANAEVWGIDDLGKRWTPATEDAFFDILDRRTSRERPVLITCNYSGDDFRRISASRGEASIAKQMIDPMLRRLRDYCDVITVQKGAA